MCSASASRPASFYDRPIGLEANHAQKRSADPEAPPHYQITAFRLSDGEVIRGAQLKLSDFTNTPKVALSDIGIEAAGEAEILKPVEGGALVYGKEVQLPERPKE